MFDQFYHTRCSAAESVIGQDEFSIRASSRSAEDILACRLHQTLYELAYYEIPPTLQERARAGERLSADDGPIRLARMRADNGDLAIVHSVYRDDAGARRGNYFSHVVLPKNAGGALPAGSAIALWGTQKRWGSASGCVWRDESLGGNAPSQLLPPWTPPEPGDTILARDAVRRFLCGEEIPAPPLLELFPRRLIGSDCQEHRQLLVELIVASFLDDQQVQLIAEPGLAALLIFALTQLLPASLTRDLTFSTYEPPKACLFGKFDVVNGLPEAEAEVRIHLQRVSRPTVLLNTLDPDTLQTVRLRTDARIYAHEAVSRFMRDEERGLSDYWGICERVVASQPCTASQLRDFAGRYHRFVEIMQSDAPVTPKELDEFLQSLPWRGILMTFTQGPRKLVDRAMASYPAVPPWWPVSPTDPVNRPSLEPRLDDLRRLVLGRIVTELQTGTSQGNRVQVGIWCLDKLLPGLTDEAFTTTHAIVEIVRTLEKSHNAELGSRSLPWLTREWVLRQFADEGFRASYRGEPEQYWFCLTTLNELQEVLNQKGLPMRWIAISIAHHLTATENDDPTLAKLFVKFPTLLEKTLWQLEQRGPLGDRGDILPRLFGNLAPDWRFKFCAAFLEVPAVSREPYSGLLRGFVNELAGSSGSWHVLFADPLKLHRLVEAVGENHPTMALFWAGACRNLDANCLFENRPQSRILQSLLQYRDGQILRWPVDDGGALDEQLDHWRRVHDAMHDAPTARSAWDALRWSLRSLSLEETFRLPVLSALIETVDTRRSGVSLEDAAELVQAAKALWPDDCDDTLRLAKRILDATANLKDSTRNDIQAVMLAESCGGRIVWFERLLDCDDTAISPDAWSFLAVRRNTLVEELRKHRPVKWLGHAKRLTSAFAMPTLLAMVWLAAVLFSLDILQSGEIGVAVAIMAGMFAIALAFFQAWTAMGLLDLEATNVVRQPRTRRRAGNEPPKHVITGPNCPQSAPDPASGVGDNRFRNPGGRRPDKPPSAKRRA
jgi:hypothetical protein